MAFEKSGNVGMASETPSRSRTSTKTQYLILYNAFNALLWLTVLSRTLRALASHGTATTYEDVGSFTKWTQTVAVLEIVHAILGLVRAPIFTTMMQVYSRLAIVWGTVEMFPRIATSSAYSTMLIAYGCTEVVRYSYFALNLLNRVPYFLHWLRYSTFLVFYPLGISSEYILLLKAFKLVSSQPSVFTAKSSSTLYSWTLFDLIVWPPSAYVLIKHMLVQRRKVLGKAPAKKSS